MNNPSTEERERMAGMVGHELVRRDRTGDTRPVLSQDEIKRYINDKATDAEAEIFIRFCYGNGLNPFTGEAYLIKYGNKEKDKAAIVVGYQAYLKRASVHPEYAGYQSGIVVANNGRLEEREGTLTMDGDTILGGWCRVYRKGWAVSHHHTVAMKDFKKYRWDYDKKENVPQSLWATNEATMIEKVAISQAIRRVFPESGEALRQAEKDMPVMDEAYADTGILPQGVDTATGEILDGEYSEADAERDKDDLFGKAEEPAWEQPQPHQARPSLRNLGDLFNAAHERLGMDRSAALKALGYSDPQSIGDLDQAWETLVASKE